jgi:hypothetical protein
MFVFPAANNPQKNPVGKVAKPIFLSAFITPDVAIEFNCFGLHHPAPFERPSDTSR